MTKSELKKIMSDNYIFDSEIDDAIQFVQDLLEFQAKELEETEPYATNAIRRLRDAAHEVWGLQEYVMDVSEGDV
jgi:hypothetical protein